MSRSTLGFVALFALLVAPASGAAEDAATALPDLSWLTGTWRVVEGDFNGHPVDAERSLLEETWSTSESGGMIGMFRWLAPDRVIVYELVTIEAVDGVAAYRLRHFDQSLVAWEEKEEPLVFPLKSVEGQAVTFESPEQRQPHRLVYRLEESDRLLVQVVGLEEDGSESVSWLRFQRVATSS